MISEQIIHKIEDGDLPKGSRLPTVRELADDLAVTRVTAHSAYTHLKREAVSILARTIKDLIASRPTAASRSRDLKAIV